MCSWRGPAEGRQAEVQIAKEQKSFNASDKELGAEEEFIQRRKSNDMCRAINEVATFRRPLQIVRAFSAVDLLGVSVELKMVAYKVHYGFVSSSFVAAASVCANSSFGSDEEETTQVFKVSAGEEHNGMLSELKSLRGVFIFCFDKIEPLLPGLRTGSFLNIEAVMFVKEMEAINGKKEGEGGEVKEEKEEERGADLSS